MINLLSNKHRRQIRAARRNSIWVRYDFLMISVIIAVNIILFAALYINFLDRQSVALQVEEAKKQADVQLAQDVKKQADDFRENIKIAKTLLDADNNYSDIIVTIANAIPENCRVQTLTVDSTVFSDVAQKMEFYCAKPDNQSDYDIVSQLLTELEKSLVFHSIYINKVDTESEAGFYLISTTLKAQDPSKKIPLAILEGCKLRTINTLGNSSNSANKEKYLTLTCRPKTTVSNNLKPEVTIDEENLEKNVKEKLEDSCYFTDLKKISSDFKSYNEGYYVADYTYSFDDITFKRKLVTVNGDTQCQNS